MDLDGCRTVVAQAAAAGRDHLFEHEAYALLEAAGIPCAPHVFVPLGQPVGAADLARLPGASVVLKAVVPGLLHKSEAGGVVVVPERLEDVEAAHALMCDRLAATGLVGVLLAAFVEHDHEVGSEVLASVRSTGEFGSVVTLALGGVHAEFLSSQMRDDAALSAVSPILGLPSDFAGGAAVCRLLTEPMRGRPPRLRPDALADFATRLLALAGAIESLGIADCEMNPLAVSAGALVALDAVVTLRAPTPAALPRPLQKLPALLRPSRVAVVGVSDHMNPGRIILRNLLREGTPAGHIVVVKPGHTEVDGCLAVPSVRDLPSPVDLLVVAVSADRAPAIVDDVVAGELARSIILIPGGFEEKAGGAARSSRIRVALDRSRGGPSGGPLLVGANCLGIRSRPGRYDTLFIPAEKLLPPAGSGNRLAVISQSGAFAIARASRWTDIAPRYIITTGNQLDVTLGDLLTGMTDDPDVDVFAVYVEGFKPGDGARAVQAVRSLTARGRSVVIYRAGRTKAGAGAAASHSASIAGDYRLTRALFEQAGAMVAGTIGEFEDRVRLATLLAGRPARGSRIGVLSNAGFECVAAGDSLGSLSLAEWSDTTRQAMGRMLTRLRVSEIVDVHNPLDLTPMTDDEGYEDALRLVLADPRVDIAVIGCVPLTSALQTLPSTDGSWGEAGIVPRLRRLWREGGKPWAAVVDGGPLFDPMAAALGASGIPVFRAADRALRALDAWARAGRHLRASVAPSRVEPGGLDGGDPYRNDRAAEVSHRP